MSEKNEFIVFGAPQIQDAEIAEVVDSLKSGWLGTGPKVARFESEFAHYKGVSEEHAAALNSCTAGIHVSLLAAGIRPGDEVITTPMTFCATVNATIHSGATPVLVDIDPDTMNIDPAAIEAVITKNTKAIIIVHFAGRLCDMPAILDIAKRHKLLVIEDCAHAIETQGNGKKAGTFGDFGCFSFYVTKNISTGEGGMVIARNVKHIEKIKRLSLHGMSKDAWHRFGDDGYKHYLVAEAGFKYNMMDLQAAIGIHQLSRVESNWLRRKEIWNRYQQAFADLPVKRPLEPELGTRHAYHLYTLLIDRRVAGISRDEFLEAMTALNIGVGVHYLSIPEHPFYQQQFGWVPENYPNAMKVGRETVSLPLSAKLSDENIADIISAVNKVLKV